MTAGMREGEKNSGQHPVWEKIPPLPGPASLHLEPAKRVTGSSQPAAWQGLTPPTPVLLSNFHLYSVLALGLKSSSLLGGLGRGRRKNWGRQWLHLPATTASEPGLSIFKSHRSGMLLHLLGSMSLPLKS